MSPIKKAAEFVKKKEKIYYCCFFIEYLFGGHFEINLISVSKNYEIDLTFLSKNLYIFLLM